MAKKKNGKPKDDYPPFEMSQTIKDCSQNRFSVLFSEQALITIETVVENVAVQPVKTNTEQVAPTEMSMQSI